MAAIYVSSSSSSSSDVKYLGGYWRGVMDEDCNICARDGKATTRLDIAM